MQGDPVLFALNASREFGEKIALNLGIRLAQHEERDFEHGEHKTRPLEEVGHRDVYVICGLHGEPRLSANDKLVRLLFFIGALKDAGAQRVTAISPYLAYSRKDRRTKPRDPVNSRYVAALFEAVETDRMITLEVHNISAFENAFRSCRPEHISLARVFAEALGPQLADGPIAVVSPDAGGNKRAELFRHELERVLGRPVGKAIMDKHRSAGVVSGEHLAGNVAGHTAIIIDDIISSGTTIMRACNALRKADAQRILVVATHPLFKSNAAFWGENGPDAILVSDAIPLTDDLPASALSKVQVVEGAPLIARVIERLHAGEPVSELLPYD